jgi:hypothetical protein
MKQHLKELTIALLILALTIGIAWIFGSEIAFKDSKPLDNLGAVTYSSREDAMASSTATSTQLYPYIEVIDSCGPYFQGDCVNIRSGPGEHHIVVNRVRRGAVLQIEDKVYETDRKWYKIVFEEKLKYPERVKDDWYVAADFVRVFYDDGLHDLQKGQTYEGNKRIVIDKSEQKLYAYEGDVLFMEESISTGLQFTPTPVGKFTIFRMTPTRYMQGPIPGVSTDTYDLPGVPWDLYFTDDGAVIHGAYWHDRFGRRWSHGCVNLSPDKAKILYSWAQLGMPVEVRD